MTDVLIVHEDADHRRALERRLANAGYTVSLIGEGASSLDIVAHSSAVDVVVLSAEQLQQMNESKEADRRRARGEAWRWRMVARVAERIALATDAPALEASLLAELSQDLPIQSVRSVIDEDTWVSERFMQVERSRAIRVGVGKDAVWVCPVVGMRLDDDELGVLEALAPHVAHAIARVRLETTRAHLALARERLQHFILHDLKNPLSVIEVNLRALKDDDTLDEDSRGAVMDALAASAQTKGMLVDLLDVGLAEEGRLPFRPVTMDVVALVRGATEPFRGVIEARSAKLHVQATDAAQELSATLDAGLVTRVLQNLVTNASRFVPSRGNVTVEIDVRDGRLVIAVENDGPAIPAAVRASLFDKYGQANAAQASHNRGLGLYFCRLVTERHGGEIRALDARHGSGARFELVLPRGDGHDDERRDGDRESNRIASEPATLEECAAIPSTSTPAPALQRSGPWKFPTAFPTSGAPSSTAPYGGAPARVVSTIASKPALVKASH